MDEIDPIKVWRQMWMRDVGRKWLELAREKPELLKDQKIKDLMASIEKYNEKLYAEYKEALDQSLVDPLTNLGNKKAYYKGLKREVARAIRHSYPVSVIMADGDGMKAVNDTYGHDKGDIYIVELGRIFKKSVRETDEVCRWGGDEFYIILPEADEEKGVEVAERVQKGMAEGKSSFGAKFSASQGLATYMPGRHSVGEEDYVVADLTKKADDAMYVAKRREKGSFAIYGKE